MKSMHLTGSGAASILVQRDVPEPTPRQGELLIRVHAAGVTPTELAWYPTRHTRTGEKRTGAVPSHEFSGEIAEIGDSVVGWSIGQEVYGMNDWFEDGALAEYCVTQPGWIARKPGGLTHAEAASVPIGALTAWQGLFERAKLQAGERVLVHGGAGAVGLFVLQLARRRGAHVITTVSAHNAEFAKELGANEVLDYKRTRFEDKARDIDVVFDTVGGETLQRSWAVLKPSGRMVTIAADSEAAQDARIKEAFFIVEPRHSQLVEIGKLIDSGELRPVMDTVLPLSRASDLYRGTIARKSRGKQVVAIRESAARTQPA
jgi:NADPH:quinone reductase-like Zn-dependent oxidoreductase